MVMVVVRKSASVFSFDFFYVPNDSTVHRWWFVQERRWLLSVTKIKVPNVLAWFDGSEKIRNKKKLTNLARRNTGKLLLSPSLSVKRRNLILRFICYVFFFPLQISTLNSNSWNFPIIRKNCKISWISNTMDIEWPPKTTRTRIFQVTMWRLLKSHTHKHTSVERSHDGLGSNVNYTCAHCVFYVVRTK